MSTTTSCTNMSSTTTAEIRRVKYSADETWNGAEFTAWELWQGGICIATLDPGAIEEATEMIRAEA